MSNLPALIQTRGISIESYNVMKNMLYPNAQSDESIILVHDYCKARGLDPMKKPVHIVPIYNKKTKKFEDTVWNSIAEVRITASRTGKYAGKDDIEHGPTIEQEFVKQEWDDHLKKYKDGARFKVKFPEWAKITVYKMVDGVRCPYTETVRWMETYSRTSGDCPTEMWKKRPFGQIDKCVEAAALRAAFPEEIGNDYIVEEAHKAGDAHIDLQDITPEPKPVVTSRLDNIASAKKATVHDIPPIENEEPIDNSIPDPTDELM